MLILEGIVASGVRDASFTVDRGETVVLLGPPLSGKTELLRSVAGLAKTSSGQIVLNGESITDAPIGRRGSVFVPVDQTLFPHMTAAENIAFGLKLRGDSDEVVRTKVSDLLSRIGLSSEADVREAHLSAEGRWRVALARAAAIEPKFLLVDEPPGDPSLGIALARTLATRYDGSVIAATEDRTAALSQADRVAFIRGGRIEQIGTPAELYLRPRTPYVADYVARANLIECTIASIGGSVVLIDVFGRTVGVPLDRGAESFEIGDRAILVARPEAFRLAQDGEGWDGVVRRSAFLGPSVAYEVEIEGQRLSVLDSDVRSGRVFLDGGGARVGVAQDSLFLLPYPEAA